jgi:hypothetical protein
MHEYVVRFIFSLFDCAAKLIYMYLKFLGIIE